MMCASVVLPRPGGPNSSTWSIASPRFARRADEDLELLARLRLADVLGEPLGPQRALDRLLVGRAGRAADDAGCRAGAARRRRAGRELVGLDAHGALSSAARRPDCRDNRRVQRLPRRLPPDLVAVRRRAAAEERGADAGQRRRGAAGPRDRRGVRRLRRRHVEARGAVARDGRPLARAHAQRRTRRSDPADHADHRARPSRRLTPKPTHRPASADHAPAHGPASPGRPRRRSLRALGTGLRPGVRRARRRGAAGRPSQRCLRRARPTAPVVDPAARWAAQLQHAPPASS